MTEYTQPESLIKGNMVPYPTSEEQERLRRLYARIDEKLAAERQAELDDLFHIDHRFASENPDEAAKLKAEFLQQKQGLNLGECFALSLQEPFFGRVHIVKLAATDHSEPGASQRILHETNDFLHWLKTQGPLTGLQPQTPDGGYISEGMGDDEVRDALSQDQDPGDRADRLRSGRWMEYEFLDDEDGDPAHQVAVIRRIRPFVNAEAELNGVMCDVKLFKETVFTIRAALLTELIHTFGDYAIANGYRVESHRENEERYPITQSAMQTLETWLYTPVGDRPDVQRYRNFTAIYSAVVPHEVDRHVMRMYDR